MMYDEVEIIKINQEFDVTIDKLSRNALLKLMERYQEYYIDNPSQYMVSFNAFLNSYGNNDLLDDLHPDSQQILETACYLIDVIDGILDDFDISIPIEEDEEEEIDDDCCRARIYGDIYFTIEDTFRHMLNKLLNGKDVEAY